MKYFSIEELTKSDTATLLGIDNTPSPDIIDHLQELGEFLDEMREAWGSGIRVNSGYRCEELNDAVRGSKTSAHLYGWAADLYPMNNHFEDFKHFVIEFLNGKKFDQCIIERYGKSSWIHFGLYNGSGKQRKMKFIITAEQN